MTDRFVFWGGYGGNNLGDEAILWAMSRLIRKLQPRAEQFVLIPDGVPPHIKKQYAAWNIQVASGKMPGCLSILRGSRLIVGGGQLVDDTTLAWPVGWSSVFLGINSISGSKPLVLCIGAEPIKHPLTRMLVRHLYGRAAACTCRDEESAAVLRDAGVTSEKVRVTRDVVFSLDRDILPQFHADETKPITATLVIAYDPNRVTDSIDRNIRLIDALLEQQIHVNVIPHDLRPDYDLKALDMIVTRYKGRDGISFPEVAFVQDVLEIYSQSDAVISSRMHPLILTSLVGSLPIAFGGKAKVKSLMKMAGVPQLCAPDAQDQAMEVIALLNDRGRLLPSIAQTVADFRLRVEDVTRTVLAL